MSIKLDVWTHFARSHLLTYIHHNNNSLRITFKILLFIHFQALRCSICQACELILHEPWVSLCFGRYFGGICLIRSHLVILCINVENCSKDNPTLASLPLDIAYSPSNYLL
jgi:hypothetical protein